ncbi:protein O-mannosyl-transferase TMTC3-like [Argonauta hians]
MEKEDSHKSYRPLCVLTFRLNYAVSGLNPASYHLVNLLLHTAVCFLLMRVSQLFLPRFTAFLAALLFALHPIHTEAVTGVVGRAESLSACFFLTAVLAYSKASREPCRTNWWYLVLTLLSVVAAMLCKEQGITVVGVCCVYEVIIAQKLSPRDIVRDVCNICGGQVSFPAWLQTSVLRLVFLVQSTLLLLLARIYIMGAELPVFTRFDNPASVSTTPSRQLTFNYLLAVNQWLLLCPSWLCCDWTMGTVPLVSSPLDPRNLFTLLFYAALTRFVVFALSRTGPTARTITMSLTLLILPFLPASNLFFPVGFVVAERVLYTPSMGLSVMVALGFTLLTRHYHTRYIKMLLWSCMVLLLSLHGLKTIVRNFDWQSEYILFKSAVKINQRNAKLFNNIGHALEKTSNLTEALHYFTFAARIQPDDIGAHINVGRTYQHLNMSAEAEQAFNTAIALFPPVIQGKSYTARVAPSHLNAFINLASLISRNGSRLKEAEKLYKSAITMRPDYVKAYMSRGELLVRLGRLEEARDQYHIALHYQKSDADIYYNIGVVSLELKNLQEANVYFEHALRLNPDHQQTLFNSALLLQHLGDPLDRPEAMRRLLHLLELKPNDAKAFYCLAILAADNKEFLKAKQWFIQAIKLEDNMRSALFNLALMLVNDLKQPREAIPYLEKLLTYYPNHTKGLILMGDININILKDLTNAEKNFQTILVNEPHNVQAMHNLCVVYVEQGDILKAEKCLLQAHSLAPSETYILQHLNIVRNKIKAIKTNTKTNRH